MIRSLVSNCGSLNNTQLLIRFAFQIITRNSHVGQHTCTSFNSECQQRQTETCPFLMPTWNQLWSFVHSAFSLEESFSAPLPHHLQHLPHLPHLPLPEHSTFRRAPRRAIDPPFNELTHMHAVTIVRSSLLFVCLSAFGLRFRLFGMYVRGTTQAA